MSNWRDQSAHYLALALKRIAGEPPPADDPEAAPLTDLLVEIDAAEAERFRLETERDLKGEDE